MIKIKFYSLIRMHLGINKVEVDTTSISILKLFQIVENQINQKFLDQLIYENEQIIPGTMILINGRNIFHLDNLDSLVEDGDEICIFPPGGGG